MLLTKKFAALLMLVSGNLSAATISVTINANNDCSGYFNVDNNVCHVQYDGELVAPIFAKYETLDEGSAVVENGSNGHWESYLAGIDGSEFALTGSNGAAGSWRYQPDGDAVSVLFWVTKTGNNRRTGALQLFWSVADTALTDGRCNAADYFQLSCLNAAQHVSSGDWSTSTGQRLSHISFYGTSVAPVPVPPAVWLFASGLFGLVAVARRRLD